VEKMKRRGAIGVPRSVDVGGGPRTGGAAGGGAAGGGVASQVRESRVAP
jgi:hypothetical protein